MVRGDNWEWHETLCSDWNYKYRFICQYGEFLAIFVVFLFCFYDSCVVIDTSSNFYNRFHNSYVFNRY